MEVVPKDNPKEKKDKVILSKSLQIDSEIWYFLIHEHLRSIFFNEKKDEETKYADFEALSSIMGRNVIEICSDDKLAKL